MSVERGRRMIEPGRPGLSVARRRELVSIGRWGFYHRPAGEAPLNLAPMRRGFLSLVAVMDWATRKLPAWRLPNTMDVEFRMEALEEALARFGRPEIFNTDQGGQFTSPRFTARPRRDTEVVNTPIWLLAILPPSRCIAGRHHGMPLPICGIRVHR